MTIQFKTKSGMVLQGEGSGPFFHSIHEVEKWEVRVPQFPTVIFKVPVSEAEIVK